MEKLFKFFVVAAFAFCFLNFNPCLTKAEQGFSSADIIARINEERVGARKVKLSESEALDNAAQMKADDMARYGYFSHTSPKGRDPWYWFRQAGYDYGKAGENLALNLRDTESLIGAWMDSRKHRDNILSSAYSETGIGISYGMYEGQEAVFVVEMFGSPLGFASDTYRSENPAPSADNNPSPLSANVLGASNSSFTPFLRLGSEGDSVRLLQIRLAEKGYNPGPADGKFGRGTLGALMTFQASNGLPSDGIAGPLTWSKL